MARFIQSTPYLLILYDVFICFQSNNAASFISDLLDKDLPIVLQKSSVLLKVPLSTSVLLFLLTAMAAVS